MDSVYPKTCDKDQELKDGQCGPKTCDKDQELKDGQCVPKTCDKDQELKDGQCINGPLFTDSPSDPKVPPNTIIASPANPTVPIPPLPSPILWGVILFILLGIVGAVIYLKTRHARCPKEATVAKEVHPPVCVSVEVRGGIEK